MEYIIEPCKCVAPRCESTYSDKKTRCNDSKRHKEDPVTRMNSVEKWNKSYKSDDEEYETREK